MLATKTRVAYALFLFSYIVWLTLASVALFPAFTAGNRIQFPNTAFQAAFVGSAITASIACLLIGVHHLGLRINPGKQSETVEIPTPILVKPETRQVATTLQNKLEDAPARPLNLWQELEDLQRKKAELDYQLLPVVEKEQNSLEMIVIIMEGMEILEEHIRELEVQLNDKHEAVSRLESRIAELERILKEPVKEPAREEPEKQLIEVTVPAVS